MCHDFLAGVLKSNLISVQNSCRFLCCVPLVGNSNDIGKAFLMGLMLQLAVISPSSIKIQKFRAVYFLCALQVGFEDPGVGTRAFLPFSLFLVIPRRAVTCKHTIEPQSSPAHNVSRNHQCFAFSSECSIRKVFVLLLNFQVLRVFQRIGIGSTYCNRCTKGGLNRASNFEQ